MLLAVLLTAALYGLASLDTECSQSGKQFIFYPFYQGAQPISWLSTTQVPPTTTTITTTPSPPTTPPPTIPPPPITSVAILNPYENNYNNIYNEYLSTYINVPMYAGAQVIAAYPNKTQILQMQKPQQVYKPPVILPPVPPPENPPPPLPIPVPAKPSDIRPEFVIVDGLVPHKAGKEP